MLKNNYGEGSIHQRKDGTWEARYQNQEYNNGKRKSIYGKTEQEVKRKLRELKKIAIRNEPSEIKRTTVKEFLERWLKEVKRNELKDKSYDRLESTIQNQINPYVGDLQVVNFSSDNVQELVNNLFDSGLSYSTVKKTYDAINSCFRTGVIKQTIIRNPALGVTLKASKKKAKSEIKFFTKEETKKLVEEATKRFSNGKLHYRLGHSIVLVLNTGLRVGELLALKWDKNIDLNKRTITVTNNLVLIKNRDKSDPRKYKLIDQDSTKSISGQRVLHLNKTAFLALLELQKETGNMKYVISSKNNQPINPRNMDRLLKNLCRVSGFPESKMLGMHSLRHTFASRLFEKGVDIKTISEILGHSDTKITYDIYIHLIEDQKKKAIEIIDEV